MLIKQTLQFIGWHVLPLLYHANGVGNKILLCTGSCSTMLHWSGGGGGGLFLRFKGFNKGCLFREATNHTKLKA